MNQKIILVLMFIISVCSLGLFVKADLRIGYDIDDLQERIDVDWNYDHSSNVVYGQVVKNHLVQSNSNACSFTVSNIKVIESFKGSYQVGDVFTTTGIGAHETTNDNTEHLLFMNDLNVKDYPGFGDCDENKYIKFQSIHNWCCSIVDGDSAKQLLMYDMVNSETASKTYTIDASIAFTRLRQLKVRASSNKPIKQD
jgi:hypothetical protein